MGGNGSFIRRSTECEDGRQWRTVAQCGKIQILQWKDTSKGDKLPEESHTPGRIYAIFRKDGRDVKAIAQYGKNGQKLWEIHTNEHYGLCPHYHKWEDKGDGKRGQQKEAHKLTKRMKGILRKLRKFDKDK